MLNSIMFFCFILLLIPRETRANALVFVFAFTGYQFIDLADSLLIYINSHLTSYDTSFYYALSTSIIYVIIKQLRIKNIYMSLVAKILVALMVVNLGGWFMYDSYMDPALYNYTSNILLLLIIRIFTWSLPGGRNFIKNRYTAMVYSFDTKSNSMQTEQRKEKGLQK